MYSTPTKMQKGRHVKAAVHKTMKQSGFQQKSKRSAGPWHAAGVIVSEFLQVGSEW